MDRLNIVAHDRFQEIIDEANRSDSPIRLKQVILDAPGTQASTTSVTVSSALGDRLGLPPASGTAASSYAPLAASAPVFTREPDLRAAQAVIEEIRALETRTALVPTRSALNTPEVQQQIAAAVAERLRPVQGSLVPEGPAVDIADVVARTTAVVIAQTIDIPRISVVPKGEITMGFHPFTLDVSQLRLQPGQREIVGQMLRSNEQFTLAGEAGLQETRLEDYIVHALVDYDDIDYFTQATLLYDLAGQMVRHLLSYLSEAEARQVLDRDRRLIAREIHAQMLAHFWEHAAEYEVIVTRGYTELRPATWTVTEGQGVHRVRDTVAEPSLIKQMLFGSFERCLYPLQKFDSDTERRFAVILERDAAKWFKPVKSQFQIYYKLGTEQPEYVPDFVAESDDAIRMVETKARDDMNSADVQAKAAAASRWCEQASAHARSVGGKSWKYLLVPHDAVIESQQLRAFDRFEVRAEQRT